MSRQPVAGSFRDPAGVVFSERGHLRRQVNAVYADSFHALAESGLLDELVSARLLVPHQDLGRGPDDGEEVLTVIEPERIPFVSYPYEWCFSQLKAAALLTLDVQARAVRRGMSLRDASAYNAQFRLDGSPVLIDTLSFEPLVEGRPWVAYGQFCRHFLAPLALMSMRDERLLRLSSAFIDGIPLDLAATLLPARAKLRPGLQIHLLQHARSAEKHAGAGSASAATPPGGGPKVSVKGLQGLVDNLRSTIQRLDWAPEGSTWADYYAGDSYSDQAWEEKRSSVSRLVAEVGPATVWDFGANTGMFSRLAAAPARTVVSLESDSLAVEMSYRRQRDEGEDGFLPLVCDLTNPSGGIGWDNTERMSLAERGPADLGLALALVHHLAIANNVPLGRVAGFFARLCKALVVEFVPKGDPKVDVLLATREDIFPTYTPEGFQAAFAADFVERERVEIPGSERTLHLLHRR